jgi:hypothetical protein
MNNLRILSDNEAEIIFGGGLVEGIGYRAHQVVDKCCEAYDYVKGKAVEAYEKLCSLF